MPRENRVLKNIDPLETLVFNVECGMWVAEMAGKKKKGNEK